MKKLTSIVLVLSLVMCLFAGCSSTKPAETTAAAAPAGTETAAAAETLKSNEPIVIGLLDAFSGDRAMNGEYTREGAEMFLEDINAAGGVLGRPVTIVYEDDQGAEASATNAYQKLVSENDICATVLNKYSSVVLAMEPFVADEEIRFFREAGGLHERVAAVHPQIRYRLRRFHRFALQVRWRYQGRDPAQP